MPNASLPVPIQYRIDQADRIRFVNEAWLQFAGHNGGKHLDRDSIIGKSLWTFVEGDDLRQVYGLIFKTVRSRHESAVFRFRCDSPVCRRYFLLTISPLQEEALILSTHLLREAPRPPVLFLDPEVQRGEQFLTICSWCLKARLSTQGWLELEDAIQRLDLLGGREIPRVTHGLCLDCHRNIEHELMRLKSDRKR